VLCSVASELVDCVVCRLSKVKGHERTLRTDILSRTRLEDKCKLLLNIAGHWLVSLTLCVDFNGNLRYFLVFLLPHL